MTTTTATRTLWAEAVAPRPLLCRALGHHDPRDGVCRDCGQATGDPCLDAPRPLPQRAPLLAFGWNRRGA